MDVKLPDGTIVQNVPDGITKAELTNRLQAAGMGASLASPEDRAMVNPTRDMGTVDRIRAGYGKAVTDIGRGIRQIATSVSPTLSSLGFGDNQPGIQSEIDEAQKRDAVLMNTAGGMTGNILGGIVTAAPALMVPGANTLTGAGIIGGVQGALQPVATGGSRALNAAIGGALGVGGQAAGNKISQVLQNRATGMAAQKAQNALRDATLDAGTKAGLVVPPSAVDPGFWTNRLESIAGKAALGQQASHQNQGAVNALARAELGLPPNQAISEAALEGIRKTEGLTYARVANLSRDAADALENLKQARADATAQFKFYNRSANPEALTKARQAAADAQTWENFLENEAIVAGKKDLIPALHAARTRIAKTYDVERALNTATGDVDARILGRALDQGRPLTGGLATAANFANAFPKYMAEGAPAAGVSKIESGLAALLAAGGAGTMGPAGALLGTLPLASAPVRAALLSGAGQRLLAGAPSYQLSGLSRLAADPAVAQALGLAAPAAALSATR